MTATSPTKNRRISLTLRKPPPTDAGRLIDKVCDRQGWSITELARRFGYTRRYVHKIRAGSEPPTAAFVEKCREALES